MANFDVKGDALHFGEGSGKHILTVDNGKPVLKKLTEKGEEVIAKPEQVRSKIDAILTAAEKGDLHVDTRDFLETHANVFKDGLDEAKAVDAKKIARIDKLKKAITFAKDAKGLSSFDETEMKTLRAGLLEHGELGERLMDKEVMKAAGIMGLEKKEIAALRSDAKKLQELMKRPVANEKLINDLLVRNHADAPALLASVEDKLITGFNTIHSADLHAHVTALDTAIQDRATQLKAALDHDVFKGLEDDLKAAKANPKDKAAIVEAEKAMNDALKEVRELTKTAEGKAAYQLVLKDKDFAEDLSKVRSASSQVASHLDGTAKATAAAAVDAGKGGWFTKSAEDIAKLASEKGVAVEKINFLGRRTGTGKVALGVAAAAGAYGLYSIVAGTGNKGPGERAEAVNRSRENGQAAGIGA